LEKIPPTSDKLYVEEWIDEKCFQVKIYTPDGLLHQRRILREMTGAEVKQYVEGLRRQSEELVVNLEGVEDHTVYTVRDYSNFHSGGCLRSIDLVRIPLKEYKEYVMREQVLPLVNSFSGQR